MAQRLTPEEAAQLMPKTPSVSFTIGVMIGRAIALGIVTILILGIIAALKFLIGYIL